MNNDDRRAKGEGALRYAGLYFRGKEPEESLIDLLADLMHYADREGLDYNDALRIARGHFRNERESEVPQ